MEGRRRDKSDLAHEEKTRSGKIDGCWVALQGKGKKKTGEEKGRAMRLTKRGDGRWGNSGTHEEILRTGVLYGRKKELEPKSKGIRPAKTRDLH